MGNLFKCEFKRLTKSVFFWIITGFCVLWPILTAVFYHAILTLTFTESGLGFEEIELPKEVIMYLTWMIAISFITELPKFSALFTCLHLGREYTDGIVRNKVIAGHSRTRIYLVYSLTMLAANAFFCVVYILSAIFGLWISGLGFNLNGGEMFIRLGVGIVVFLSMVTIFSTLALIFRKRALPIILSIIIAMISSTTALVIGYFNMPAKAVNDYIDMRSERYEEMVDYGMLSQKIADKYEEDYDKNHYLGIGWKIFHPVYVITPIGFESDYQAATTGILFGADLEYTDEIDFSDDFVSYSYEDMSMFEHKDFKRVKSMHMSYSELNLIYLAKSFFYIILIGGWGLFIFRKKNLF